VTRVLSQRCLDSAFISLQKKRSSGPVAEVWRRLDTERLVRVCGGEGRYVEELNAYFATQKHSSRMKKRDVV
jgi:hypothetical protein